MEEILATDLAEEDSARRRSELLLAVLSVDSFSRRMELLDVCAHHVYSLRFLPSTLAAAALILVVPAARSFVERALDAAAADLQHCLGFVRQFAALPHLPPLEYTSNFAELKVRTLFLGPVRYMCCCWCGAFLFSHPCSRRFRRRTCTRARRTTRRCWSSSGRSTNV